MEEVIQGAYTPMNEYFTHYDIHVYFEKETESEAQAVRLRDSLKASFPSLRMFPPQRDPIGPHPVGMWEAHMITESQFA